MSSEVPALSPADVNALLTNPDAETRAEIVGRVASSFVHRAFSEKESQIALEILRAMAGDAEILVRETLALQVRASADIPKDLATTIARDVDRVASPFLQATPVLTDADLIAIIRGSSPAKQAAIANRPLIGEELSDAIIATRNVNAVSVLAANEGARLTERQLTTMIDHYGRVEAVNTPLAQRATLPVGIAERLVTLVSERLKEHILTHHALSADLATDLMLSARERATLALGSGKGRDLPGLVTQLYLNGRLTPSLLVRAACMGDMRFIEEAFARLAKISVDKAYLLIHDGGDLGLRAIYLRTGLPEGLLPVFRSAVTITRDMQIDGEPYDAERFTRSVIERTLTALAGQGGADTEYLLAHITKLQSAMASDRLRKLAG
ncbi:MAG: DUF2336 domain-containing protein [Alphaproteobacteria bacterium]|nr:DUF2336 domain-containing protein [Alphaproteobacteria bacterium]